MTPRKFFTLNPINFNGICPKPARIYYFCSLKDHMKALLSLPVRNHTGRLLFSALRRMFFGYSSLLLVISWLQVVAINNSSTAEGDTASNKLLPAYPTAYLV
jgi:hypothetical protein